MAHTEQGSQAILQLRRNNFFGELANPELKEASYSMRVMEVRVQAGVQFPLPPLYYLRASWHSEQADCPQTCWFSTLAHFVVVADNPHSAGLPRVSCLLPGSGAGVGYDELTLTLRSQDTTKPRLR